ncbi:hypothetical protein GCM10023074_61180 [Microbispora amethystogenes]|uniref:Transposase n=1 Tax=Microbispora amethystogenes TaxID=1427754 RepID=A0ABQ4FJK5_9ACTN|nr:hypothetical protein Mam01_51760 [Microbispora amethystogenes]
MQQVPQRASSVGLTVQHRHLGGGEVESRHVRPRLPGHLHALIVPPGLRDRDGIHTVSDQICGADANRTEGTALKGVSERIPARYTALPSAGTPVERALLGAARLAGSVGNTPLTVLKHHIDQQKRPM